tara:strand:- start:7276 stop:8289 length:1014 start_codon:yes stop_codon:yes gene_type:complete
MLSSQLSGFKKTGENVYNFRCPECLDSQRKKNKKRGYLYQKDGKWIFYCHNCHFSTSFKNFLKKNNAILYDEFVRDSLNDSKDTFVPPKLKSIVQIHRSVMDRLQKVSSLLPGHPTKDFVIARQIPTTFHFKLYHCSKFKSFVNTLIPDKFIDTTFDEPRLVIPIFKDYKLVGLQGRAIEPSEVKYITIVLDESAKPMIYGYDEVEWNARHIIVEGPLDSCFIPNAIAVCGSALLKAVESLNKPKNYSILVFDNEPRNKEIISSMKKAIRAGYRICIWPNDIQEKDINDMVLTQIGKKDFVDTERVLQIGNEIKILIEENTFFGLKAELRISQWAKV